jgi:hypothetical protein
MSTRTENGRLDLAGPAGIAMVIFTAVLTIIAVAICLLTRSPAVLAWVALVVTFAFVFAGLFALLEGGRHYEDSTFAFVLAVESALTSSGSFAVTSPQEVYASLVMAAFALEIVAFLFAHWRTDYPAR